MRLSRGILLLLLECSILWEDVPIIFLLLPSFSRGGREKEVSKKPRLSGPALTKLLGFAAGIMYSGTGIGGAIFPFLMQGLLNRFSYKAAVISLVSAESALASSTFLTALS